jgi:hypothetical protein
MEIQILDSASRNSPNIVVRLRDGRRRHASMLARRTRDPDATRARLLVAAGTHAQRPPQRAVRILRVGATATARAAKQPRSPTRSRRRDTAPRRASWSGPDRCRSRLLDPAGTRAHAPAALPGSNRRVGSGSKLHDSAGRARQGRRSLARRDQTSPARGCLIPMALAPTRSSDEQVESRGWARRTRPA